MLVQDFLRAGAFFEFDPGTGALERSDAPADPRPKGVAMKLGEANAVFFAERGRLALRIGEETVLLKPGFDVSVRGEDLRHLAIEDGGTVLLRHAYLNPIDPPMDFDLGMAEEEDFDLGLYVAAVASSRERADLLLERWT